MNSENRCHSHESLIDPTFVRNRRQSLIVLILTAVTMVAEIYFGWITGSMALLADGWHMATHAAALGITYFSYQLAVSERAYRNLNFGGGKVIFLGGFTSGLVLLLVAVSVAGGAVSRLMSPVIIQFNEALVVAVLGLVINVACAFILRDHHHGHDHGSHHHGQGDHGDQHHDHDDHNGEHHHDINIRGAYLHVLADALTSVAAIVALLLGKFYGLTWTDPLIAIVASLVILKWSVGLIRESAWELLDGHARGVDYQALRARLAADKIKILDLHVWRVAPRRMNCELVVEVSDKKGTTFYRQIIEQEFGIHHSVIEERSPGETPSTPRP